MSCGLRAGNLERSFIVNSKQKQHSQVVLACAAGQARQYSSACSSISQAARLAQSAAALNNRSNAVFGNDCKQGWHAAHPCCSSCGLFCLLPSLFPGCGTDIISNRPAGCERAREPGPFPSFPPFISVCSSLLLCSARHHCRYACCCNVMPSIGPANMMR